MGNKPTSSSSSSNKKEISMTESKDYNNLPLLDPLSRFLKTQEETRIWGISANEHYIAAAREKVVTIFDIQTMKRVCNLNTGHKNNANIPVAFNMKGNLLATSYNGEGIQVWNVPKPSGNSCCPSEETDFQKQKQQQKKEEDEEEKEEGKSSSKKKEEEKEVFITIDQELQEQESSRWISKKNMSCVFIASTSRYGGGASPTYVQFNPVNDELEYCCACADGRLSVYNFENAAAASSSSSAVVVANSNDDNSDNPEAKFIISEHTNGCYSCCYTRDGVYIIIGVSNHLGTIAVHSSATGEKISSISDHTGTLYEVVSAGDWIVSASLDGTVNIRRYNNDSAVSSQDDVVATKCSWKIVPSHTGRRNCDPKKVVKKDGGSPVNSCNITRDGKFIVCSTSDGVVALYETETGQHFGEYLVDYKPSQDRFGFSDMSSSERACCFLPSGNFFASGNDKGVLRVWKSPISEYRWKKKRTPFLLREFSQSSMHDAMSIYRVCATVAIFIPF